MASYEDEEDIYAYYLEREQIQSIDLTKLPISEEKWKLIIAFMLHMLDDTLMDVEEIHLQYFLAISIFARYLLKAPTISQENETRELQNLSLASLYIANKYEIEEFRLDLHKLGAEIDPSGVIEDETRILSALDYFLGWITPFHFIDWFGIAVKDWYDTPQMRNGIIYLLLLGQQSYVFGSARPSHQAAAAIYLARVFSGISLNWTQELIERTGIDEQTIIPYVNVLVRQAINEAFNRGYISTTHSPTRESAAAILNYYSKLYPSFTRK